MDADEEAGDLVSEPAWLRGEVLRVLHKFTAGMPLLREDQVQAVTAKSVTQRDLRFTNWVHQEDLDLINACLEVEQEEREHAFAVLEHLLALCQFSEGPLDERVLALPKKAFALAALDLHVIGWVGPDPEEEEEE